LGWKGPQRSSGSNPPAISRDPFHQPRVLRAPSSLALDISSDGAATASLGSLGQGLTTLMGKNFFLISHLNLPSVSLEPSPPVLSLHPLVQSPSPSFLSAPPGTGSSSKVTPEPSLLQAEQPQPLSLSSQQRCSSPRKFFQFMASQAQRLGPSSSPAAAEPCPAQSSEPDADEAAQPQLQHQNRTFIRTFVLQRASSTTGRAPRRARAGWAQPDATTAPRALRLLCAPSDGGFSAAKDPPGCAGAVSGAGGAGVLLGNSPPRPPARQHIRPLGTRGFGRGMTGSCLECVQSRAGFTSLQ